MPFFPVDAIKKYGDYPRDAGMTRFAAIDAILSGDGRPSKFVRMSKIDSIFPRLVAAGTRNGLDLFFSAIGG